MFQPPMEKLLNVGRIFSLKIYFKFIKELGHALGIVGKPLTIRI
jgi:hypothetical protein